MARGLSLQVSMSAPPIELAGSSTAGRGSRPPKDMSRFGEAAEAAPERFSVLCNELSDSSVLSILMCLSLAQHSAVLSQCAVRGARATSGVT